MLKKPKKTFSIAYAAFAAMNLLTFLFLFIPYYVLEIDIGYLEYVRLFFGKLVEFTLPPIAATLIFISAPQITDKNFLRTLVRILGFALTRAILLVPYYYLYFIAYGYDSVESIGLSLLVTLFGVLLFSATVFVMYTLMREIPIFKISRTVTGETKEERRKIAKSVFADRISDTGAFDFGKPVVLGIFASCFVQFAVELIRELVDTVQYLIDYAGMYRTSEIIYISACFVFLLVELIGTHAFCYYLKKRFYYNETNIEEIKA